MSNSNFNIESSNPFFTKNTNFNNTFINDSNKIIVNNQNKVIDDIKIDTEYQKELSLHLNSNFFDDCIYVSSSCDVMTNSEIAEEYTMKDFTPDF
jgi:hypothetical protein